MSWYTLTKLAGDFDDLFDFGPPVKRTEVSRRLVTEEKTINLYRGFDAEGDDLSSFNKTPNGDYIFSPAKSEQGVIWFSHDLQRNPKSYSSRGDYLLTYPLTIKVHYEEITYDDGEISRRSIDMGAEPTENSKYMSDFAVTYELPEGFYFSYKTQKHIICAKDIEVSPSMITEQGVLYKKIYALREQMVSVAQEILDAWRQDEEGFDEELGLGGPCDSIAQEIANIIHENIDNVKTRDWGHEGDNHAAIIAYTDTESYYIDIPYHFYETGGGYNWTKLPDVKLVVDNVIIEKIDREDFDFDEDYM